MRTIQESLAVSALGAPVILCLLYWNKLPMRIPIHFGISGEPDVSAGRDALWIVIALAAVLFIGLTIVSLLPRLFNLPVSRSDLRRARAEHLAVEMLGWVKVEILWLFAVLVWRIIAVALGRAAGLGVAFLPVSLLTLAATIGWYAVQGRTLMKASQHRSDRG